MADAAVPNVELFEVAKLVPYERNAKKHPPEQISALAAMIKANGWTQPIVVDRNNVIIVGHGRRMAALQLGLKRVPVIKRADLSDDEVKAMRLADNRVTSTDYDGDMIKIELSELSGAEFDMTLTGFSDKELDFLTADLGQMDDGAFVEDVNEAVAEQRRENEEKEAAVDQSAAPIGDALGFKRCTVAQSRAFRGYMTAIEAKTGQIGAEALLSHLAASIKAD